MSFSGTAWMRCRTRPCVSKEPRECTTASSELHLIFIILINSDRTCAEKHLIPCERLAGCTKYGEAVYGHVSTALPVEPIAIRSIPSSI